MSAPDHNARQGEAMARAAGVARCSWHWAVAEWQRQDAASESPPEILPDRVETLPEAYFPTRSRAALRPRAALSARSLVIGGGISLMLWAIIGLVAFWLWEAL